MFLLGRVVADIALSLLALRRKSGTNITSLNSTIKDDIACWSNDHDVIMLVTCYLPCKSLQVREKRFVPALGQNFMGHRIWTCSVPLT